MAVSWRVVRRAASSSSITWSAGFSVFCSRFVPFSTRSSDDTPTQSSEKSPFHDFGDRIENEITTNSNCVLPVPSGYPFVLTAPPGSWAISMVRRYRHEAISVSAPLTKNLVDEDCPILPLKVKLFKRKLVVTSHMTCKPDQLQIHRVIMRDSDTGMKEFTDYLGGIGITSKMISLMCDRLGCRKNKA